MPDEDRPVSAWSRAEDLENITVGGEPVTAPPAPAQPPVVVTIEGAPEPTIWNIAT